MFQDQSSKPVVLESIGSKAVTPSVPKYQNGHRILSCMRIEILLLEILKKIEARENLNQYKHIRTPATTLNNLSSLRGTCSISILLLLMKDPVIPISEQLSKYHGPELVAQP